MFVGLDPEYIYIYIYHSSWNFAENFSELRGIFGGLRGGIVRRLRGIRGELRGLCGKFRENLRKFCVILKKFRTNFKVLHGQDPKIRARSNIKFKSLLPKFTFINISQERIKTKPCN